MESYSKSVMSCSMRDERTRNTLEKIDFYFMANREM